MSNFKFVRIPCDSSSPIVELTASTAGGLEQDEVMAKAREFFHSSSNPSLVRQSLESQMGDKAQQISDSMLAAVGQLSSVEIFAVTVPTAKLSHIAVSLYCDDHGVAKNLPVNARATNLVRACGHTEHIVRGDCFLSRYFDNDDDWKRVDFTSNDCAESAGWVQEAKEANQKSPQTSRSLSQLLQSSGTNALPQQQQQQQQQPTNNTTSWGSWTETNTEIEAKIKVPANTTSKTAKINMKPTKLDVSVGGNLIVGGDLANAIVVDDSTWTIEGQGEERFVCLLLVKRGNPVWGSLFKE